MQFWCDSKFAPQAKGIIGNFDSKVRVQIISSGKLRRYNNLPLWRQLLRPVSIVLPNIRDMLLVGVGFLQSVVRLILWRPDAIFTKGGFVCLPVGLAARLLKIPLIVHDSDAHPGLTNRILSRFATAIATGAPLNFYPYDHRISRYVGIPIAAEFTPLSAFKQAKAKQAFGFNKDKPLVVVTGGGLGASRINMATAKSLNVLLKRVSVALISGTAQYDELKSLTPQDNADFKLYPFIEKDMAVLLGAADIVVTRAGATTVLELAALAKPTILIPNAYLTGGHQLKNAAVYAEKNAVVVLGEDDMEADEKLFADTIFSLFKSPQKTQAMAKRFHSFAKPNAASDVADMILAAVKR